MTMRIWTLGAKVPDVDGEIAFVQALGGELVLDDLIAFEGDEFRIPLVRLGDKYVHIAEQMVYERWLNEPLPNGLCHVVFEVDDLEGSRARALAAGATEIVSPAYVRAGFGRREVAFFRSPGGVLFEFIRILEATVPSP
jgi:catechol 2,3-dioxygenase-like lactoylglutathione lyase family enzyme